MDGFGFRVIYMSMFHMYYGSFACLQLCQEGGVDMRDLFGKLNNFFSRSIRYFVYSFMTSIPTTLFLFIVNKIMGVKASFGFYIWVVLGILLVGTVAQMGMNFGKLFSPINRQLIVKLEQERLERARLNNRRKNKKSQKKVS